MQTLNPAYLMGEAAPDGVAGMIPGALMFVVSAMLASVTLGAAKRERGRGPHPRGAPPHALRPFSSGSSPRTR